MNTENVKKLVEELKTKSTRELVAILNDLAEEYTKTTKEVAIRLLASKAVDDNDTIKEPKHNYPFYCKDTKFKHKLRGK